MKESKTTVQTHIKLKEQKMKHIYDPGCPALRTGVVGKLHLFAKKYCKTWSNFCIYSDNCVNIDISFPLLLQNQIKASMSCVKIKLHRIFSV